MYVKLAICLNKNPKSFPLKHLSSPFSQHIPNSSPQWAFMKSNNS